MILEGPIAKCQSTRKPSQAGLTLKNVFTTATVDNIDRPEHVVDNGSKFTSWHQHFTNTAPYCEGEGVENASFKQRNVSA